MKILAHLIDAGAIPFIATTGTVGSQTKRGRPNMTRIIEAIIIALITALVSSYVTIQTQQKDIEYLKASMAHLQSKQENLTDKLEKRYAELLDKIYQKNRK